MHEREEEGREGRYVVVINARGHKEKKIKVSPPLSCIQYDNRTVVCSP